MDIDRIFKIFSGFFVIWALVAVGFVGVIVWAIIKLVIHFTGG